MNNNKPFNQTLTPGKIYVVNKDALRIEYFHEPLIRNLGYEPRNQSYFSYNDLENKKYLYLGPQKVKHRSYTHKLKTEEFYCFEDKMNIFFYVLNKPSENEKLPRFFAEVC